MQSAEWVVMGLIVLLLAGAVSGQDTLPFLAVSETRGFYWKNLPASGDARTFSSELAPGVEPMTWRAERSAAGNTRPSAVRLDRRLFAQASLPSAGALNDRFEIQPMSAFSNDKFYRWEEHFALRAGYYEPTGGDNDSDGGFFGELDVGTRLGAYADISLQIGYMKGDNRDGTGRFEVRAVPIMIGLTGNLPLGILEPYVGGSVGFAFSSFKFKDNLGFTDDKNQTLFAWNFRLGMNLYILEQLYVGLEARHMGTDSTTFRHRTVDLDGVGILLAAAYRF